MSSHISKDQALTFINNYRQGLPPGETKSVWLNREIIEFILTNANLANINGLRVYLARYDSPIIPAARLSPQDGLGQVTVIAVPTAPGPNGEQEDMSNGYFNYGKICPSSCNGDVGS